MFQLLVSVYGGYFGAGIGILMLAALGMMGLADIHVMNGVKNLCASSINASAIIVFAIYDRIEWHLAMPMFASAIVGGYVGARVAQRINPAIVRRLIMLIGFTLAAWYFYRQIKG